ncbi:MAG: response regulator transcription factor, partial [Bacteroidia bacterium]|nr:response regulator transcription factor [Bacteroidia bacterium]
MKTKKIRVVLFDDNLFFRQFINIMMDERKDIDLVGVFENANNLVRDIESTMPDMVLMDIDMPGTNGIAAVKIIRKKFPELPVMILTDYDKEEMIVDAISAGANGYILKVSSEQKIIDAIFDVHRGEGSLSPGVTRKLLYLLSGKSRSSGMQDLDLLSPREREVLSHLVQG